MDVIRDISKVMKILSKCRTCGNMVNETELEDGEDCFECRIKKGNEYWEWQRERTFNGGAYTGQERGENYVSSSGEVFPKPVKLSVILKK